jgi:GT2 family glycosyltransferase
LNASPTVSVVVPTFERRASLDRLLQGLAKQRYPLERFEVIVVDDGSKDGTLRWLSALTTNFDLRVLTQSHAGPAAARNRGVAAARGEIILFLDDDVVPAPDLVATHVATHQASPATVAIGPMLPPGDWKRPPWIQWEEQKLLHQYAAMSSGLYACTYRQLFTANASLARERFTTAGGFDVRFDRAEDVELGYRLHTLGMGFVFEPRARVWHYPGRSFASWRRMPYRYGHADVLMQRDKGVPAMRHAVEEFRHRRALTKFVARRCVGRPVLFSAAKAALIFATYVSGATGLRKVAAAALSGLFSLLYWQGVSDALGDPNVMRSPLVRDRGSAMA